MNKKRRSKKSDQEVADRAFKLLHKLIQENYDIEPTLWTSAMWTTLAQGYVSSGISYKNFCNSLDEVKIHYKYLWKE